MEKSELLNSAIIDANKMKRSVHALSKLQLEETFQPTLQRMISARLAEEDGLEDETDEFDINIDIEPEISEPAPPAPEMTEPEAPVGLPTDTEELPMDDTELPDEGEEDLDLESVLRELDGGMSDEFEDDGMMGSDGEDIEELTEEEVDALYEFLELDEADGLGDSPSGRNKEDGGFESKPNGKGTYLESKQLRQENAKLKRELNEALMVVTDLKKSINDVNLLNAKLMYTTKAIKSGNFTQDQQMKIMEAIDRGTKVREVQLIYAAIVEAYGKGKSKQKISEGLASKTVRALNPKKPLNESTEDSLKLNWQRRAGIAPPADF